MDILKRFRKGKKPLSADVIALLAQAHQIHEAELEFARDEVRAELRQSVRDVLMGQKDEAYGQAHREAISYALDKLRIDAGILFCETRQQREEWVAFVKENRRALNEIEFERVRKQTDKAVGYKQRELTGAVQPPYQAGENGTHASGGVVASW
jgi:hypothetical protein